MPIDRPTLQLNCEEDVLEVRLPAVYTRGPRRELENNGYFFEPNRSAYIAPVTPDAYKVATRLKPEVSAEDELELRTRFTDPEPAPHTAEEEDADNSASPAENCHEYIGFIVEHSNYGLGRLLWVEDRIATVEFFSATDQKHQLAEDAVNRTLIPIGTHCTVANAECRIKSQQPGDTFSPHSYEVENDDGLVSVLPETELTPIEITAPSDPLTALSTLQQQGYAIFHAREALVTAHVDLVRRGGGVKSLLSSRIDLHGHQAYVAGTVILDNKQRYLLADEVGLGKTIEAGIVVHDLLSRNSDAKILVLCPGALLQQWFSEMFSKFSGVVFRLPDLSGIDAVTEDGSNQVIASFYTALVHSDEFTSIQWDLIVIDEVHRTLAMPSLYALIRVLSHQESSLLLLSALPAQRRDREYYDLLALLEPQRYLQQDVEARMRFSELLERQHEIGGRIRVVRRRVEEMREQETEDQATRVLKQLNTLMELPVLVDDAALTARIESLSPDSPTFIEDVEKIIHFICDYYRINRRILRNRRERLIETDQLSRIERGENVISYAPDQYELDALYFVEDIIRSLEVADLPMEVVIPFVKQLFQAAIDPETLVNILAMGGTAGGIGERREEYEGLYDISSYPEADKQLRYFWNAVHGSINPTMLENALDAADSWAGQGVEGNRRLQALFTFLVDKHRRSPEDKFIIFAGFPELAATLAERLTMRFRAEEVASFRFGLHCDPAKDRALKEKEVHKFMVDRQCWLLVCDETGGEGRNFQFVAELIHYDLPLQASKIEQRIGRLDRLGRKREDVISNVIVSAGGMEEVWFQCLSDGLGVFKQSISGLEFGLREIEIDVINCLMSENDQTRFELPAAIQHRVQEERALDESQSQMDEASYERTTADRFRRVQSTPAQDRALEHDFCQYVKIVSENTAVRFLRQADYPEGIVAFQPDDTRHIHLRLKTADQKRTGTFRRTIAQERPDLEFFCVGNDLFDAVCDSLWTETTGRTYAVECEGPHPEWRGFEFLYRLTRDPAAELSTSGDLNRLEYLLSERVGRCFVDERGVVVKAPKSLLQLRKSLDSRNRGTTWRNITKDSASHLHRVYPNWHQLVTSSEKCAQDHVRELYGQVIEPKLAAENSDLCEQIRQLQVGKADNWEAECIALEKLRSSINSWDIVLDGVGFLSVHGGVLHG